MVEISLPDEIDKDWKTTLQRLDGAYADGTLRAYRADIRMFVSWCENAGQIPFPAQPSTISKFITHEADRCSPVTIKRRLSAIRKIHSLLRLENPVEDEDVKISLRRVLRAKISRPHQALGLNTQLRQKIIDTFPNNLIGKRNRALIAVGYDTLARRSELVSLLLSDFKILTSGDGQMLIRRAKNDPYGSGRIGYISKSTVGLLSAWLEAAEIKDGVIFRSIQINRIKKRALHPCAVNRILKQAARNAALSPETVAELSGHSMRIGAAQDLVSAGVDMLSVMQAGGWKTIHVVSRYVEAADITERLRSARNRMQI
jgi:integrase/recombinase XerD